MKKIPQDIVGNIAILKFPKRTLWITKKLKARKFLKQNKTITTVVEKTGAFSGKLRTHKTKHLAGIKTKQATYKENNCTFKFNIDKSYFSPRLSNERKVIADEVAKLTKKNSKILVMFAGIAPYPIIIAKKLKHQNKSFQITANELNKEANKEAKKNIILNKLQKQITIIPGDAKKLPTKTKEKFDIILMPRPNLKDTFLKTALKLSKKGTVIFYHGFGTKQEVLNEIKKDIKNKIGKIKIRKAGDIAPYKFRWQAQFKVKLN
jgi:tRNA (guanine37-N1)-methyltransferase